MLCIVIKVLLHMYEICFKVLLVNCIASNSEQQVSLILLYSPYLRGMELITEEARELIL